MIGKHYKIILALLVLLLCLGLCSCEQEQEDKQVSFGPTYDVGEIIVNLADVGQARYAKANVVLEVDNDLALDEVQTRTPQIRDIVIEIFSSKEAMDLLNQEGKQGIKNSIKNTINSVLNNGKVEKVYFTTIVVQ